MDLTDKLIVEYPKNIYSVKENEVYILKFKTTIHVVDERTPLTINQIKLSEKSSMKFRYLLGSFNFLYQKSREKIKNEKMRHYVFFNVSEVLMKLVISLEETTNQKQIEQVIQQMDVERLKIKEILR
ncbi:hypothetical protein IMCC3317_07410 [Kordia antarctica]|uniref:Uncharacterized protein n=1 Tax=Kordia antarctica TaxID=1218801 RepID=A0A7L4ZFK4_9FLAO|nr:hypothetical protein [Kordia antarctica]QHI35395.1 hypothetical protein IMCC3317_07410 [Kordia antarctica]